MSNDKEVASKQLTGELDNDKIVFQELEDKHFLFQIYGVWYRIIPSDEYEGLRDMYEMFVRIAADSEPVRHAHWIEEEAPYDLDSNGRSRKHIWCSACNQDYTYPSLKEYIKYCYKCGAKMDGGETHETK